MKGIARSDIALAAATVIFTLVLIAPAATQSRSLPPPPSQMPPPLPPLAPLPAPLMPPRPNPEIGARPLLPVPGGEARQTERVCIEKGMCVDVPVSPKASPGSGERK